jgi:uncharacterized protein (DUF433 family)
MDWRNRIVSNPDILLGKPTIKGTRISVELILGCFGSGWSIDEILEAYPRIGREDVLAALAYARHTASARQLVDGLPGQDISPTSTIHFVIEAASGGGYTAKAVEADIFTEADDLDNLHARIRDAVHCHFDDGQEPEIALCMSGEQTAAGGIEAEDRSSGLSPASPNTPDGGFGAPWRRR